MNRVDRALLWFDGVTDIPAMVRLDAKEAWLVVGTAKELQRVAGTPVVDRALQRYDVAVVALIIVGALFWNYGVSVVLGVVALIAPYPLVRRSKNRRLRPYVFKTLEKRGHTT